MSSILTSVVAFLVAIAVLVAVHEFGHFWVARRLGIKVLRFSIGFGKPIWRRVGKDADRTEYVISNIPLGGYVKMLDERETEVDPSEQHRAFNRQPALSKIAVLAAGPMANFILAIAFYWLVFVIGVPGMKPLVGEIEPGSYADVAGLKSGDEILSVGESRTSTWEATLIGILDTMLEDGRIPLEVKGTHGDTRNLVVDIGEDTHRLTEPGQLFEGLGMRPMTPLLPARLGEVLPDGAAAAAGLQAEDLVTALDGAAIGDWRDFVEFVRAHPQQDVQVTVERGGRSMTSVVSVRSRDEAGEQIGFVGVQVAEPENYGDELRAEQRYGVLPALNAAANKTWNMSALTLRLFWRMLFGDVSLKNISGPINIAQYAGYTASVGAVAFLSFLAIVSISLGLINLMPIPMLDGGQIVYTAVEAFKGSPLSPRTELLGQQIGVGLLLMLMSLAFYNDIARLVTP